MKSFYNNKRVLITGHTGFKGSWLTLILVNMGAKVLGISNDFPNSPNLFKMFKLEEDIDSRILDIRDYENINEAISTFNPEIVFHLAAQPLVRESYIDPRYTYETNVIGTLNILECIRSCDNVKSVINVTTDKVYENKEWIWAYRENENLDGFDPYSNSKSCSELVTRTYKRSFFNERDISISSCRAGNVIGGGDFSKDRIIPDTVSAIISNQSINLRSPNSVRPYQHVIEPLYVYLLVAQSQYLNKEIQGEYNIGPDSSSFIKTIDLVTSFKTYWGTSIETQYIRDDSFHEANLLMLDSSRLKFTFNWLPKWNIDTTIKQTVEWYKAYHDGSDMREFSEKQIELFGMFG